MALILFRSGVYNLRLYLFLFFLFFTLSAIASTRKEELLRRRERISAEIASTESLLKKLDLNKSEVIGSLALINKKIALRRDLIDNLNAEVAELDVAVDSLTRLINRNQDFIDRTKKEYATVIYRTYFYFKPNSLLMLLFSSPSLGVMYRRYIYLRQYSEHRRNLIVSLRREVAELYENSQRLASTRAEKVRLISLRRSEIETLNRDLSAAQVTLKQVQKRSRELLNSLDNLKAAARKVEDEIRKIVESEIQKAKASTSQTYSRQVAALSAKFEQNKGKLPFPVANGVIVSEFGEQPHPVYKGIKINNNGIDISTDCNVPVFPVFGGVVSKVFFIKGSNYAVIIRHGNFYTVYQNLASVNVSAGVDVKPTTVLGNTACMNEDNVSRLHFEIWQDLQKLDPRVWLAR